MRSFSTSIDVAARPDPGRSFEWTNVAPGIRVVGLKARSGNPSFHV